MKLNLPISSLSDIETFIITIFGRLPQPSAAAKKMLLQSLPLLALIVGSLVISAAIVPLLGNYDAYDIFAASKLFFFNIILLRFTLVIMGIILIGSFQLLASRKARGWYNLFYLSVFHLLFLIILPSITSLLALILTWYVLSITRSSFT